MLIALAVLLLVPCYLAVLSLHAAVTANDAEGLVAIFWIATYSAVLWLPLLVYWFAYRSSFPVLVRRTTIAPVLLLALVSVAAVVLW